MRHTGIALTLAAAALALGGCAAFDGETGDALPTAPSGRPWLLVEQGRATPSPSATMGRSTVTPEVPLPPLPSDSSCTKTWLGVNPVLIPIEVTPGSGSFTVEWPTQYDSNYRLTAVVQPLVSGAQPESAWIEVPPGAGCTVRATITGLTKGVPYIVWLDAPNSGREVDGTRHLYSGRSGVVYTR